MMTEQEQAFVQEIELAKDRNLCIPKEELKRYYDIIQREEGGNKVASNADLMAALLDRELETYKVKNQKYGNSFDLSVEKYGLISALTRMSDKWNRIENLILTHDNGTDDESLKDSLMDLANYCNMTVLVLERGVQK